MNNTTRHILWIIVCTLFVFPPTLDAQQTGTVLDEVIDTATTTAPAVDLSTPRDTMRTFLIAAQDASQSPERIDDAARCIADIDAVDDEDELATLREQARRLHVVIDGIGLKIDDIPADADNGEWIFHQIDPPTEGEPKPTISLVRSAIEDGTPVWRFSQATIAALPAFEAKIAEQVAAAAKSIADNVRPAFANPRAAIMTFHAAMKANDVTSAIEALDATGRDAQAWSVESTLLAQKLFNVMNKVKYVVEAEIPIDPPQQPFIWYTHPEGSIELAQLQEGDRKGEWRFTPATVSAISALESEFEDVQPLPGQEERLTLGLWLQRNAPPALRREFPPYVREAYALQIWQWIGLAGALVVAWLVRHVAGFLIAVLAKFALRARSIVIDQPEQRVALRSTGLVAATAAVWFIIQANFLLLPTGWLAVLLPVTKFAFAAACVWVGYRLVDVVGGHITADTSIQLTNFDDVLIPLLRRILRIFIVIVVILFVCDWFGLRPTTVLGALGIGGVALAFASQDTLNNFFGSVTVLFDRPFGIGDWVAIGNVEGTVERVGFRSTRVRTFYNSLITIPNSQMVSSSVDNYGARKFRRNSFKLSVVYSTPPDKIEAFCEGVRELIRLHPYTRKDYYHVYLNSFEASSLDILVYMFFQTPDWSTELREKHALFVDIIRLANKLGVDFAFPTQTVWLERSGLEADKHLAIPHDADAQHAGLDAAAEIFKSVHGAVPIRPPVVIETKPKSLEGINPAGDDAG